MATYDPQYWREKAEEVRTIAERLASEEARGHMLACAASYDRLAELAEKELPARHPAKVSD
jgi:hypothetical protein